MAKRVGLSIYGLSLYDGEKKINLNNVKDSKSIVQLIKEHIDDNGQDYDNDIARERVSTFTDVEYEEVKVDNKKEYSIIYGLLKTGEYGVQSELFDVHDKSVYNKKTTQAEINPFGFCIALAKGDKTKAVVILQTFGNLGIKTVFRQYLEKWNKFNKLDYGIMMDALYPIQYIRRVLHSGILQKIRMIKYEVPEDVSNRLRIDNGVKMKEERILYKPSGFIRNNIKKIEEFFSGQRSSTQIVEIPDFDFDQLKFEFSLNGKSKTINFDNTQNLRVNEDITDHVTMDNGNPTFQSLKVCLIDTAYEYLKLTGFVVD